MQIESKQRALIIGAGSFGTAIAIHLARVGCYVYLWTRDEECAASINKLKKNNKHLKDQILPDMDWNELINDMPISLLGRMAVPNRQPPRDKCLLSPPKIIVFSG